MLADARNLALPFESGRSINELPFVTKKEEKVVYDDLKNLNTRCAVIDGSMKKHNNEY